MSQLTFFGGDASDLGHVRRLSPTSFGAFVDQVLNMAVTLNVSREEYASLPKEERMRVKRVPYVVPCTFPSSPCQRLTPLAQEVNLLCLDVDDSAAAAPYFSSPETLAEQLMPFNFAIHTTASSTPQAPRVRILVEADHLPVSRYADALRDLARRIGLVKVNKESLVVVQPMYLPTLFRGEKTHPLLFSVTDGRGYGEGDILPSGGEEPQGKAARAPREASPDDLDYLRPTLAGVTLEDVAGALNSLDPDCSYPEWLEIAAGLRHQFPHDAERAYQLFDEWSSRGTKYVGPEDTEAKWFSLRPNPQGRVPVTIRSLLLRATAAGWDNGEVKARCFTETRKWIAAHKAEVTEATVMQFISQALAQVAATPMLSQAEEENLLKDLTVIHSNVEGSSRVLARTTLTALKKDLKRIRSASSAEKARKERLPDWAKGICYVTLLNKFLRPNTGEQISPEALDRAYGMRLLPTEAQLKESGDESLGNRARPILRPQDYLLNVVQIPVAYDTIYAPDAFNETFISQEGKDYVNTFIRNYPEPDPLRASEAGEILMDHLANLFSEVEYRAILLDFLAHVVQRPGVKIRWAVLLQGAQGCGKTFFAEMMKTVLGKGHVFTVSPQGLGGNWNEWAHGSQLITLEEVRVAGQNRHEVMNALKPLISNDTISIQQRFRDNRNLENKANYLLFTNHHDALALSQGDRRYFVLKSSLQTKAQVAALGEGYFTRLFGMLTDNASGLRAFLESHPISPDFPTAGPAPVTSYVEELIQDSASELTAAVREAITDRVHPWIQPDMLSATSLLTHLIEHGHVRASAQYLASILRDEGWTRVGRCGLSDGDRHALWVPVESRLNRGTLKALADQRMREHVAASDLAREIL